MTLAGVLLIWGVLRTRGASGLAGLPRALLVSTAAAALALVVGRLVTDATLSEGVGPSLGAALLGAVVTTAVLVVVVLVANRRDARALLGRFAGGGR